MDPIISRSLRLLIVRWQIEARHKLSISVDMAIESSMLKSIHPIGFNQPGLIIIMKSHEKNRSKGVVDL